MKTLRDSQAAKFVHRLHAEDRVDEIACCIIARRSYSQRIIIKNG
mgnify:CR=1 FL=1